MYQETRRLLSMSKAREPIKNFAPRRTGTIEHRLIPLWVMCIVVLSGVGLASNAGNNFFLFGFFFAYAVIALSLLLQNHANTRLGTLFLWAIIVRLVMVLIIEAIPPVSTPGWIRYFNEVIWKDEGYYLQTARWLGQSLDTLMSMNLQNPYERLSAYYALWILLWGDASVWGRLANTFVGAMTSVIIHDTCVQVIHGKTRRWVFWLAILSPVLIHFSVVYLKEALLLLAISLVVNAIVKLQDSPIVQLAKMVLGVTIGIWVRNVSLLPLLLPLGLTLVASRSRKSQNSFLFLLIISLSVLMMVLIIVNPLGIIEYASLFRILQGADTLIGSEQRLDTGDVHLSFPFFEAIVQLPGPLRRLGFVLLVMISPTITSVWHMLPILGNPDWYVFAVTSHAISWWVSLPFVAIAAYRCIREQDAWWLSWSAALFLWIIVAANAKYGAGYDSFRYRDALTPVIMLLAARGLDTVLCLAGTREGRMWMRMLKMYAVFVVALIVLAGIGVIGV